MTDPGDGDRLLLTVLFAAWALAFATSFYAYVAALDQPGHRPRVMGFLGWQGVAGVIAIAVFGVSRRWPSGAPVRRLGVLPLVLDLLLVATILAVVFGKDLG